MEAYAVKALGSTGMKWIGELTVDGALPSSLLYIQRSPKPGQRWVCENIHA